MCSCGRLTWHVSDVPVREACLYCERASAGDARSDASCKHRQECMCILWCNRAVGFVPPRQHCLEKTQAPHSFERHYCVETAGVQMQEAHTLTATHWNIFWQCTRSVIFDILLYCCSILFKVEIVSVSVQQAQPWTPAVKCTVHLAHHSPCRPSSAKLKEKQTSRLHRWSWHRIIWK